MPTKPATPTEPEYPTRGLTGPADTDDPAVRVSTARPQPTETDLRTGTIAAAVVVPPPTVLPLQLATEHRMEVYDAVKPDGSIVVVTHNMDTGQTWYRPTDRRAYPLPVAPGAAPDGH